jgi:hypothetical protein
MSQVRTEKVEICPENLEEIVQACQEAGYTAKIIDANKSRFSSYQKNAEKQQVVEITGHGIETYGKSVVEVIQKGEGVEFQVDLHMNRAANDKKFKNLKSNVHAHFQKNRAIKAAKKRGFTIAQNEEDEDKIIIKVRKFI